MGPPSTPSAPPMMSPTGPIHAPRTPRATPAPSATGMLPATSRSGPTLEPTASSIYRAELSRRKILTPSAEHDLAVRFRSGDREAGRLLIEACLSYVLLIAREYRRWGSPMEDIVQQGNIGLLKAAERFDPERGCRLATFAAPWIRGEIRDYVMRDHRMVRLGSSKPERRAIRFFHRTRVSDPAVLAAMTGLSEPRATELLPVLAGADVALDGTPGNDRQAPADRLADGARSPEEEVVLADTRAALHLALETIVAELSPREQHIVERRLMSDEPATLEQLGTAFGVSKERVRQIEERTKKRMRGRLHELANDILPLRATG